MHNALINLATFGIFLQNCLKKQTLENIISFFGTAHLSSFLSW